MDGAGRSVTTETLELPAGATAHGTVLSVPGARLWSPEDPYLYDLKVTLASADGQPVDEVGSYLGMRKISLGPDANGHTVLHLNNRPYFQYGPLDQGWWPDGLYTAATPEAMIFDLEMTKAWGFNMLRKHVKVEPATFYQRLRYAGATRLAGYAEWLVGGRDFGRPAGPYRCRLRRSRRPPVRARVPRNDRSAARLSEHRSVGTLQRGVGAVRHRAHRRLDAGLRPQPASSMPPAGGPTVASATSTTYTSTPGPVWRRPNPTALPYSVSSAASAGP